MLSFIDRRVMMGRTVGEMVMFRLGLRQDRNNRITGKLGVSMANDFYA